TRTIVATAAGCPEARASPTASRNRSISRRSIRSRWHKAEGETTGSADARYSEVSWREQRGGPVRLRPFGEQRRLSGGPAVVTAVWKFATSSLKGLGPFAKKTLEQAGWTTDGKTPRRRRN